MTYKELRAEVLALGFETETDSDERLLFAVRRAMMQIFTERPFYKTLMLAKPKMSPILVTDELEHRCGEQREIGFAAKSYSFISSGEGKYTVKDARGERTVNFGTDKKVHRGFLYGSGSMIFSGDYFYTVYELAFFDELYGSRVEDIPVLYGSYEYDIKSYTDDFLAAASLPEDADGHPIDGGSVSAGRISIPTEYHGRVLLRYKAAPSVTDGREDEPLLLPEGCEHLLPLLTAAYVWLDDDSEKAEYYMMLYREGMASVRTRNRDALDSEYIIKDGWA